MISEYDAVKKILDSNHVTDIDDIEYGGECFDELMDYFADEMPYGVKKARTGMPDEWIYDKLIDLGFDFYWLGGAGSTSQVRVTSNGQININRLQLHAAGHVHVLPIAQRHLVHRVAVLARLACPARPPSAPSP